MKKVNGSEGWEVGLYSITPDDAQGLIAQMMENQRSISESSVRNLVSEMNEGKFGISNDAIVRTSGGIVINGQHRLEAIRRTGTTQKLIVMTVPDDKMNSTLRIMDCGVARTIAHVAAITSGISNAGIVASVVKHYMALERGLMTVQGCYADSNRTAQELYVSRDAKLDFIASHSEALQISAATAKALNGEYGLFGASGPAFLHFVVQRKRSRKHADEFLAVLYSGVGRGSESVNPLRKAMIKDMKSIRKVSSAVKTASIFKAFKSWESGTIPSRGFVCIGDAFPKI